MESQSIAHHPDAGLLLARAVIAEIRRSGKHFLPSALLSRLAEIRSRLSDDAGYLAAFLEGVLDKHEGRFHNRTYLALPLLERIMADPRSDLDAHRLSILLISDVIRFETERAAQGGHGDDRPDPRTLRTRLKHALRFVTGADAPAFDIGSRDVLDALPAPLSGPAGAWFDLTVAPVHVLHDEYFFIRVLQSHEMVFTVLVGDMRAATCALRHGAFEDGIARLDRAAEALRRAALLFRIVATMRSSTFSTFREFTQGASAIQSEQYKRFEVACGRPRPDRLHSAAFTSVPTVLAETVAGGDDLSQVYLDGGFTRHQLDALDERLGALECAHQRWKAAHHGLAARMLGDASGSGYTAGVPYLRGCMGNRLFWRASCPAAP